MSELTYTEKEVDEIRDRFFREGYVTAVTDYGIWRSGTQVIGCLDTPVKEVLARRFPNTPCDPNWRSVLDEASDAGPEPAENELKKRCQHCFEPGSDKSCTCWPEPVGEK